MRKKTLFWNYMNNNSATPQRHLSSLTLGALGIVYGDIGTSPLYALRECFYGSHAIPVTRENVMGILSLICSALLVVISIKYVLYVMRADNKGEGGILALTSLVIPRSTLTTKRRQFLFMIGLFGAALFYGDGMITPAISVLSAVEGLEVATPLFSDYVIPITIVILCLLFSTQKRGTGKIGAVFGPIILLWFLILALLGLVGIWQQPEILEALNPLIGIEFLYTHHWQGFLTLGAVFLVVTGGEALYADMGHFGRKPIYLGWFWVVLPSLLLNYLGQGAHLLVSPESAKNPFFHLAPSWALYPLVVLSTLAAVIASQALISGAFSITRQAVQLGYLPRFNIQHTSQEEIGQIYVPVINAMLLFSTIWLVLFFQTSSNLATAYGIAVTTTMLITTFFTYYVSRAHWGWPLPIAVGITLFFILIDASFFAANLTKVSHGGWFPLLIAGVILVLMATWRRGREILAVRMKEQFIPLDRFVESLDHSPPTHVPGLAVFLTGNVNTVPPALVHNLRHNKVLHEQVLLITIQTQEVPHVPKSEQLEWEAVRPNLLQISLHYGFMDSPDLPQALTSPLLPVSVRQVSPKEISYFLGRETLLATANPGMAIWREKIFAFLSRNAQSATTFFRIPPNQVVEMGMQIEI
jgi:KUP system potassium uptake protein